MPPLHIPSQRNIGTGLYTPSTEKDGCGIGLIANISGKKSPNIVHDALLILKNLFHRGAQGADRNTGDGAGILTQIPHDLFQRVLTEEEGTRGLPSTLPQEGRYGVAMIFLPRQIGLTGYRTLIEEILAQEKLGVLAWRRVPINPEAPGELARRTQPEVWQAFVQDVAETEGTAPFDQDRLERRLFLARKRIEHAVHRSENLSSTEFAIPSFSSRTIVYKGMLLPDQLPRFYPDLEQGDFRSAIALVHSRFSTNTFPSWRLAHPFHYLCHNGEINTLRGNINWMRARERTLSSPLFDRPLAQLAPLVRDDQSDSACLDNMLELLTLSGRALPHSVAMLVPEAWQESVHLSPELRAFYEYHATLLEPWDGPAALAFTDGVVAGAALDRNGLRPCRYWVTRDGRLILSSEVGVLPIPASQIAQKGRVAPGQMLVVDTRQGRLLSNDEIKKELSARQPYTRWLTENRIKPEEAPAAGEKLRSSRNPAESPAKLSDTDFDTDFQDALRRFGYTQEELRVVLNAMAATGEEVVSSMGSDTPLAVLSDKPQLLFKYFRQLFAQVTNPPIDPIREQLVMSLQVFLGPQASLLDETPQACHRIELAGPILTERSLQAVLEAAQARPTLRSIVLPTVFDTTQPARNLEAALDQLCLDAENAIRGGTSLLILSDRHCPLGHAPIPSLLAVSAVHQYLIQQGLRTQASLIVQSGEPRDVHHFACLLGYGAEAIHPYLAIEAVHRLAEERRLNGINDPIGAEQRFIKSIHKGLLKICSKMGVSTIQSYCGAQIFEAVGLDPAFTQRYFGPTPSRIGGIGIAELAHDILRFAEQETAGLGIEGSEIHYRVNGERHAWNPEAITLLQHATRSDDAAKARTTYAEFARLANEENSKASTLRGLLEFDFAPQPLPLEEIEPAAEIVKRFTTGAMSLGAISREAHETLAIAMNRLGAKSNTGEGGEDEVRYQPLPNGDSASSAIKQIASGRFGVTTHYLANSREIQIKMAQGAKPGEGGQLPGHKVDPYIARLRYSVPGVQLISPPPHHDIYSIEDLKQLIFDLKNVNPEADVSVKLVSEVGVGTVAAGVAKAHADKILISGDTGGTGASPLSSIKYAGLPWELGIAETHQTLVLNGLRSRVRLETDGQLKTGRDVVIAALLGAEEFGFATAPLIVQGCIMMRKCHLNTCPVGIATQDPALRAKFAGKPEHLINYFFLVAEEARALMAQLGFRTMNEMIGRSDRLRQRELGAAATKAHRLDLSRVLQVAESPLHAGGRDALRKTRSQEHGIEQTLDARLLESHRETLHSVIEKAQRFALESPITNSDRSVGTLISGRIAKLHGSRGLPEDTLTLAFKGAAGQSFGAFAVKGVTLRLEGEANDYVGKGLSGGKVIIFPPADAAFPAASILIGNTAFYGATGGEAYVAGTAGERFAVRNSGATAVVEGVGDHGCEYMTHGLVVVLGPTGRNFAAGMSGGVAYVLDEDRSFASRCNLGLVELEPLNPQDEVRLLGLIQRHADFTGSERARRLLSDWPMQLSRFVKVMPQDYKRALRTLPDKSNEALVPTAAQPLAPDTGNREMPEHVPLSARAPI